MGALLLVMVGGGLGAACRFVIDGWIRTRWRQAFPVATVTINVTGSLLIGVLAGAHLFAGFGSVWSVTATSGFCGGYTTFSTAMVETVRLIQAGRLRPAALNAFGTLVACVAAASAGVGLVWWMTR
jgi:CrcB protein